MTAESKCTTEEIEKNNSTSVKMNNSSHDTSALIDAYMNSTGSLDKMQEDFFFQQQSVSNCNEPESSENSNDKVSHNNECKDERESVLTATNNKGLDNKHEMTDEELHTTNFMNVNIKANYEAKKANEVNNSSSGSSNSDNTNIGGKYTEHFEHQLQNREQMQQTMSQKNNYDAWQTHAYSRQDNNMISPHSDAKPSSSQAFIPQSMNEKSAQESNGSNSSTTNIVGGNGAVTRLSTVNKTNDLLLAHTALANVFSLHQRLSSLMNEAQEIILKLQEFGTFPKMSEISGGPSEAAVLLMSLLANVSSIHGENNNTHTNMHKLKYPEKMDNNNNFNSNYISTNKFSSAVSETPFLTLSSSSSSPAEAVATGTRTSVELPSSSFSPPNVFTEPYTYPGNLPFAMTPFSQHSALPTSATPQQAIQPTPMTAQTSQLPSLNVTGVVVNELSGGQLATESIWGLPSVSGGGEHPTPSVTAMFARLQEMQSQSSTRHTSVKDMQQQQQQQLSKQHEEPENESPAINSASLSKVEQSSTIASSQTLPQETCVRSMHNFNASAEPFKHVENYDLLLSQLNLNGKGNDIINSSSSSNMNNNFTVDDHATNDQASLSTKPEQAKLTSPNTYTITSSSQGMESDAGRVGVHSNVNGGVTVKEVDANTKNVNYFVGLGNSAFAPDSQQYEAASDFALNRITNQLRQFNTEHETDAQNLPNAFVSGEKRRKKDLADENYVVDNNNSSNTFGIINNHTHSTDDNNMKGEGGIDNFTGQKVYNDEYGNEHVLGYDETDKSNINNMNSKYNFEHDGSDMQRFANVETMFNEYMNVNNFKNNVNDNNNGGGSSSNNINNYFFNSALSPLNAMGCNVSNPFVSNELNMALNNNNNSIGNMNITNANANAMTENNSGLPATGMLACVEFKRGRIRKYHCEREDIEPGTYVLVDGDRGTDCGLLVQTTKQLPNGSRAVTCMDGCDVKDEKVKLENGRVIRPASNEDIERLHNIIANAEAVALKTCRQRCEELGIEINLIDVEYQFDMKKISFFFDCDHSVDFRGLVRELYRTFGARI